MESVIVTLIVTGTFVGAMATIGYFMDLSGRTTGTFSASVLNLLLFASAFAIAMAFVFLLKLEQPKALSIVALTVAAASLLALCALRIGHSLGVKTNVRSNALRTALNAVCAFSLVLTVLFVGIRL